MELILSNRSTFFCIILIDKLFSFLKNYKRNITNISQSYNTNTGQSQQNTRTQKQNRHLRGTSSAVVPRTSVAMEIQSNMETTSPLLPVAIVKRILPQYDGENMSIRSSNRLSCQQVKARYSRLVSAVILHHYPLASTRLCCDSPNRSASYHCNPQCQHSRQIRLARVLPRLASGKKCGISW